jgi:hypothetical protein
VLNLIKHYAMMTYVGADVYIHVFLTSALDGDEWPASRPGDRANGTPWIGGLVNLRTGPDDAEANILLLLGLKLQPLAVQPKSNFTLLHSPSSSMHHPSTIKLYKTAISHT